MAFVGMDLEEVRGLADRLALQGQQLQSVVGQVDGSIDQASYHWPGPDSDAFRDAWFSTYRPALTGAADQLAESLVVLLRQIEEQAAASGEPIPAGVDLRGLFGAIPGLDGTTGGGLPSITDLLLGAFGTAPFAATVLGVINDWGETANRWSIDNLPGGRFWGSGLKGVGLGFALSDLASAVGRGDLSGGVKSSIDAGMTAAPPPISLLWTGLSSGVGFFLPLSGQDADSLYQHLQTERGLTPAQITERWAGIQGFINYGNDNVARHAPWLVDGADRLLEKPGEWLYNVGIRL